MATPLPPVDGLRCFVAAAEHLNFRRAATEVTLTPAALSQRIKQLEDMLQCVLFERTSRFVALTPAGEALLERARPALEALRACTEVAHAKPSRVRLVVGTRFELEGDEAREPAVEEHEVDREVLVADLHRVFGAHEELARTERARALEARATDPAVFAGRLLAVLVARFGMDRASGHRISVRCRVVAIARAHHAWAALASRHGLGRDGRHRAQPTASGRSSASTRKVRSARSSMSPRE